MEINLRDYQQELYNNIKKAFKSGSRGVCAVLPCRAGKSFIMAKIAADTNKKGNKVLILAHRNSLINQHKELFENLELNNNNMTRIESVFTEVNHLGEKGDVDLIIIDEGHLSGASSYQKVCQYYKCRVILFTATPARLDGKPLNLADEMVKGIGIKELIKRNCVSDFNYYAPDIDLDLSSVKKTAGDYNNKELEKAVRKPTIYGDIFKYYKELGDNRQAIAYCVNIQHSKEICEMFNSKGVSAKHIDSKTNEKERQQVMEEFKNGEFKILCNCNLISEGITLPTASVGLLLRPTLSLPLYIQQACRVLTPMEGKKAIIIDYAGNVLKHGLPTQDRDWSLNKKVKEYTNENEKGEFKLRICKECFSTFETAPICPYCGAEYELDPIEIQNMKEIELKKIEEMKAERKAEFAGAVQEKVSYYTNPKDCRNWFELVQWCRVKGYKPGYAYVLNKQLKLNYKPFGGKK